MQQLLEELNEVRELAYRYKHEKDELVKKIRVLLKENEKSTNLVALLAKQDEEFREELG